MSTFAERLSEVIADSKLTKTKFAEVVGISQPFLSQICSGVKVPSSRTVSDICSKFHVDEIWLRTGDGKMHLDVTRREAVADFLAEILSGGGTPEQIAFISDKTITILALFSYKIQCALTFRHIATTMRIKSVKYAINYAKE